LLSRPSSMKATTAVRTVAALGAVLVLVSGCASRAPASARTVSLGDAGSSATASATHTATTDPLVEVSYGTWGFKAMRPSAWRSYPYEFIGTLGGTIGYLSTDALKNPCRRTPTSLACEQEAVLEQLSTNGVLIRWDEVGRPGITSISAFPGDPLMVDGSRARLEKPSAATESCRALGGSVQIQGTVLRPDVGPNFVQLDACLGPDAGRSAELDVDALFRSIELSPGNPASRGRGRCGRPASASTAFVGGRSTVDTLHSRA